MLQPVGLLQGEPCVSSVRNACRSAGNRMLSFAMLWSYRVYWVFFLSGNEKLRGYEGTRTRALEEERGRRER